MTTLGFANPDSSFRESCLECNGTGVRWASRTNGTFDLRPHVCPRCVATGYVMVQPHAETRR